jgi:eight-cysteine-cluster-containing protein
MMPEIKTHRLLIAVIGLMIVGVLLYGLMLWTGQFKPGHITTYAECAAAGYPILESYPSQCKTPDGRTFVNPNEHVTVPNPVATSSTPTTSSGCVVGGCSKELCTDATQGPVVSPCIYMAQFACYKTATCERQGNGRCGWTQTPALQQCLSNSNSQNSTQ